MSSGSGGLAEVDVPPFFHELKNKSLVIRTVEAQGGFS